MDNNHNISPFFLRRINQHKFEKTMRKGISYIYYDSNGVDDFKWKLVKATLENYIFYKYNINIDELPTKEVDDYIEYMIDIYDPVLKAYYYNFRKMGKNTINENDMVSTLQNIVDNTIEEYVEGCETLTSVTWPDWLSFNDCDVTDSIESVEVISVKKNEIRRSGYLNLGVKVNVYYKSVFDSLDISNFFYSLRLRIQEKYKITIIFSVEDEVNNQVREW
jgi:hypothetical protein